MVSYLNAVKALAPEELLVYDFPKIPQELLVYDELPDTREVILPYISSLFLFVFLYAIRQDSLVHSG